MQVTKPAFNRITAVHEAGHAVAYCHFAHGFHYAHVAPDGERYIIDRRDRVVAAAGLTEPRTHFDEPALFPHGLPTIAGYPREKALERGLRVLICSLAGPYAEARHRRCSCLAVILGGGSEDWDEAKAIAAYIKPDDPTSVLDRAERIVRAFLRERDAWGQITALADNLLRHGRIDGSHAAVRDIEGWRPKFVAVRN